MTEAQKPSILIIEDDPVYRRIYRTLLENEGLIVIEASDGQRGVDKARKLIPSAILLDLVLPELLGIDVLKQIRNDERTRFIPVIILSSISEPERVQQALDCGANDFTIKGTHSPRDVLTKLHNLLNPRHATAPSAAATISYRIAVKGGLGDAARLAKDFGLSSLFHCPHCNATIFVELTPQDDCSNERHFDAHFVCSRCGHTM